MRKLPTPMRIANYIYQLIMICFGLVNVVLLSIKEKINPLYYELWTVILAWLPVGWSKILDLTKKECGEITTPSTPETQNISLPSETEQ